MDTLIGKDTATQQELEAVLKEASEAKISKDDDKRKQIQAKLDEVVNTLANSSPLLGQLTTNVA